MTGLGRVRSGEGMTTPDPRDVANQGIVYLIHFERPFKHAKHYLGFTKDLDTRMWRHLLGRGSRLMRVVSAVGLPWRVVGLWTGTRADERRMKSNPGTRYCPVCRAKPFKPRGLVALPVPEEVGTE